MTNAEEAIHYLDMEIEQCKKRLTEYNPMYDGVEVGDKAAKQLTKHHIWFCEQIKRLLSGSKGE